MSSWPSTAWGKRGEENPVLSSRSMAWAWRRRIYDGVSFCLAWQTYLNNKDLGCAYSVALRYVAALTHRCCGAVREHAAYVAKSGPDVVVHFLIMGGREVWVEVVPRRQQIQVAMFKLRKEFESDKIHIER